MALTISIQHDHALGDTIHLYNGVVDFDSSYPTGGEAFDVSANSSFQTLLCQPKGGYVFEWDASAQKLKAYYGDNNNAADGPLIEVPATTDLSAVTGVQFIAIGS